MSNKVDDWKYISDGIEAKGHTPIYKMHKYFARRPQNVFNALAENYSKEGQLILDPFCGGGVSVVEGTSLERRVIGIDVNPLAAFITKCEASLVDVEEYMEAIIPIREEFAQYSQQWYLTTDRDTGSEIPVRWYELAYKTNCPFCGAETVLDNGHKLSTPEGKEKNGWYTCTECGSAIKAADAKHLGHELVTTTYKITTRATQKTVVPNEFDRILRENAEAEYLLQKERGSILAPEINIPENWDRQQEDCLHRKGVKTFDEFFTRRTLLVMSKLLELVRARKDKVSDDVYDLLLLTFSATLRYTNNMSISTSRWQDGRPTAWAKHAYWLSNQFVEVNPVEYLDKRIQAIKSALIFQKEKFDRGNRRVSLEELIAGDGDFCVLCQDSSNLKIDDDTVDLVLTDPPYGGNVQYGELSAFWLTWIKDDIGLSDEQILDLSREILVQRKNKVNNKDHKDYYEGLLRVFSECYRVLKPGHPLVFTFNSKDTRVWTAVIGAAVKAGFILEPEGLIYQSPIENYKQTAHTRSAGTVHGDFIYTFVKPVRPVHQVERQDASVIAKRIRETIPQAICDAFLHSKVLTTSEIYIHTLKAIIPMMLDLVSAEEEIEFAKDVISGSAIEDAIKRCCDSANTPGTWTLRGFINERD